MAEDWQTGFWLLMDAAGPKTVYGILYNGQWYDYMSSDEPFIAGCQPAVEALVGDSGLRLDAISGVIYASGPGSTLGLRLAAMFIRSLLRLPGLGHWKCFWYNNLELAAVSLVDTVQKYPIEAIAPWRRDRVHRVRIRNTSPLDIDMDALHPDELDPHSTHLFPLGNRPRNLPKVDKVLDFPTSQIPDLLTAHPGLLHMCDDPLPFSAESPDFAKWSSKRHTAQ